MNEENKQPNAVKSSNLGFLIGVLLVVGIVMLVYKSSFVQNRLGKESNSTTTTQTAGGFEIIDEPEITLIGDDEIIAGDEVVENTMIIDEVVEDKITEELDTHEPVDTAIGDLNPLLITTLLFGGAYLMSKASKRINKI